MTTAPTNERPLSYYQEMFWRGLLERRTHYDVEKSLEQVGALAMERTAEYPGDSEPADRKGLHPFLHFLLDHKHWETRGYPSPTGSFFRKMCDKFVQTMPREDFSVVCPGYGTFLTVYSALPETMQKSSVFEKILRRTPDALLECTDGKGYTALMHAVDKRRRLSVNSLLRRGVNVNASDSNGINSLMLTVSGCEEKSTIKASSQTIFDILVKAGAQLDAVDNQGRTLAMHAYRYKTWWVEDFLAHGGDINARDNEGNSLIERIVQQNYIHDLNSLHQMNIPGLDLDLQIKDKPGFLAWIEEQRKKYPEAVKALMEDGGWKSALEAMIMREHTQPAAGLARPRGRI